VVVDRVPGDPYNPARSIHDDRDRVAPLASDLAVHEKVLELLLAGKPEGLKTVARPPIPYGQPTPAQVTPDNGHLTIARR
jgi:hypothetical protein